MYINAYSTIEIGILSNFLVGAALSERLVMRFKFDVVHVESWCLFIVLYLILFDDSILY